MAAAKMPVSLNFTTGTAGPLLTNALFNGSWNQSTSDAGLYATASSKDIVAPDVKMSLYVLLVAITLVGVVGNAMTIASVAMSRKLQTVPNVYVVNLAIADLAICAMSAPFSIFAVMQASDLNARHADELCRFMGALTLLCLIMTIVNLTLISVNRYILLVRGSKLYMRVFTRRNVALSVGGVYVLAMLGLTPPLVGFGEIGYNYKMGICIFIANDLRTYWYVQGILHIIIAGPCISLTVFCYVRILMHFRAAERRVADQAAYNHGNSATPASVATRSASSNGGTPRTVYSAGATASSDHDSSHIEDCELSSSATSPPNGSGAMSKTYEVSYTSVRHKRSRASRRVTFNLLTVFLIFLVCWLPIILIFTIDVNNEFPAVISHFAITLAMANSCINVFIYAGMNRGFRKTYWYLLSCQCSRLRTDLS